MKKFFCIFAALTAFLIMFSGCNSNAGSGSSASDEPLYDENLEITEYYIAQTDVTETRVTLNIAYKVSKSFKYVKLQIENDSKEVESKYVGYRLSGVPIQKFTIKITPYAEKSYGKTTELSYTTKANSSGDVLSKIFDEDPSAIALSYGTINFNTASSESFSYEDLANASMSLSNAKDKRIFLVQLNADEQSGLSRLYYNAPKTNTTQNQRSVKSENDNFSANMNSDDFIFTPEIKRIDAQVHVEEYVSNGRSADDSPRFELSAPVDYQIGDSRVMYAGLGEDTDNTIETTAKLVHKTENCYVWVCDGFYAEGEASGAEVNLEICETLADIVEKASALERNIFGTESNEFNAVYADPTKTYPLSENSPTGEKVNILLYDISSDYEDGKTAGIYGFFTRGDYLLWKAPYNTTSHSNGGKFLHLDSGFARTQSGTTKSTVVHEFQHMIHNGMFATKGKISETWYNEMCSMLAEDLLQEQLELKDTDVGKSRFNQFVYTFTNFPFFKWDSSVHSGASYANAYGLGHILAKKYGGADFIYELTHDAPSGSIEGLLEVVRKHDPSATKESILLDIAIEMATAENINKTVVSENHVMDDYKYPMRAFDLLNFVWTANGINYKGPYYYSVGSSPSAIFSTEKKLEPNQISTRYMITAENDTLKLDFEGIVSPRIKSYILATN